MSENKIENVNPPVSFEEIEDAYENGNKPKMDWVKNGLMSIEEFNRLKLAENEEEYKEIWLEIEEERREQAEQERRQERW
jgi:hypothetical protein